MEQYAKQIWETAYPDRRPWDQLEEDTRKEWTRVFKVADAVEVKIINDDFLRKLQEDLENETAQDKLERELSEAMTKYYEQRDRACD